MLAEVGGWCDGCGLSAQAHKHCHHATTAHTFYTQQQAGTTGSSRVPNGLICLLNYLTLIYLIHTLEHNLLFRHIYTAGVLVQLVQES